MEQEIARAMERPDGKVVAGQTYKKSNEAIQHNNEVPSLERTAKRRKRILPPEAPLPCDTELVDEAFMFEVRKSLVSLHAKINRHWGWVDELD